MDGGSIVVYVKDDFGYYNSVPSSYHLISGYGFRFLDGIGLLGFEASQTPTVDYDVRVVSMSQAAFESIENTEILTDYNKLINRLNESVK